MKLTVTDGRESGEDKVEADKLTSAGHAIHKTA